MGCWVPSRVFQKEGKGGKGKGGGGKGKERRRRKGEERRKGEKGFEQTTNTQTTNNQHTQKSNTHKNQKSNTHKKQTKTNQNKPKKKTKHNKTHTKNKPKTNQNKPKQTKKKKFERRPTMESAFSAPAPPHATAEMNAASAACGRANAPRAVASHPAVTKVALTGCTPADATDDETAAASEGAANANPWGRSNASVGRADAAEDDGAASDEDVFGGRSADQSDDEEVKDPKGIIGSSAGRYNEALLQRAGSPTRAEPGWAERPPPDGIARVAGAIILCQRHNMSTTRTTMLRRRKTIPTGLIEPLSN